MLFLIEYTLKYILWASREDKQDVFARRACLAFLTFSNAAFLSGVTVELPCHCKPPQVQSVVWFFRKHSGGAEDTRALTDLHGNKLLDSSLLIFRAGPDDAGVYVCGSAHNDFFYEKKHEKNVLVEYSSIVAFRSIPKRVKAGGPEGAGPPQEPYRVFTGFQPWSVCDRCGIPGEQVRVGLCYVHSRFLHVRYRGANQTASCGSGALPAAFSHLRRNGATLEVRSCRATCPGGDRPSSRLLALLAFLGYSNYWEKNAQYMQCRCFASIFLHVIHACGCFF
uniref:Ig-like domain-containing protein n=1 Tax=Salarias fasciatus TaxID=181472 RepID=A0A672HW16_SALFA